MRMVGYFRLQQILSCPLDVRKTAALFSSRMRNLYFLSPGSMSHFFSFYYNLIYIKSSAFSSVHYAYTVI